MKEVERRITKLENLATKGDENLKRQLEFTIEEVELVKNLCMIFKHHFKEYLSINWDEKPKSDNLKDVGYTWCKNLASIIPKLLIHHDLMERVKAIPELGLLVKLAESEGIG